MMPPDKERIAYSAVRIMTAYWKAMGIKLAGRLNRLVDSHKVRLANPPRVPAMNPANPPLRGPSFTMTPDARPAMKGPISGRATPSRKLMRNPMLMAKRRSAVLSFSMFSFFGAMGGLSLLAMSFRECFEIS